MPNRNAKARKQARRKKNDELKKYGRTPAQIARKKKRGIGKSTGRQSIYGNR
tara:strand:+ start:9284 stop:9439 length:156 start_codon:yes stop_codon:yes gene_type:complete